MYENVKMTQNILRVFFKLICIYFLLLNFSLKHFENVLNILKKLLIETKNLM